MRSTTAMVAAGRSSGVRPHLSVPRAIAGASVAAFLVTGWTHRWMSDDGFFTLRVARQLASGYGPVTNRGERVEASTSTLWTAVLALLHANTTVSLPWLAVVTGLAAGAAGIGLAVAGTARLHASDGRTVVPAGVLVVLALPPFWEFATSGLETGAAFGWLGLCWYLLVRVSTKTVEPRWWIWTVAGLGPLIRPDLTLATVGWITGLMLIARPRGRRLAAVLTATVALPLTYELFRMAYFATLVPTPALTKEAGRPWISQGFAYLDNFVSPYLLWLPLLLLIVATVFSRFSLPRVSFVPIAAGVMMAVYIVTVGGDFMHARLLLPALFMVLLPVFVLPLSRRTGSVTIALIVWSIVCAVGLRVDPVAISHGIVDERATYVRETGRAHPVAVTDFAGPPDYVAVEQANALLRGGRPQTLGRYPHRITVLLVRAGAAGYRADDRVFVVDLLGLAEPLAARMQVLKHGRVGHEKLLQGPWVFAEYVAPSAWPADVAPAAVRGLQVLACQPIVRLDSAIHGPLTVSRILHNIVESFSLTQLRIPQDPYQAVKVLCH